MNMVIGLAVLAGAAPEQVTTWLEWAIANESLIERFVAVVVIPVVIIAIKLYLKAKNNEGALDVVGHSIEMTPTEGRDLIKASVRGRMAGAKSGVQDAIKKMVDRVDAKKGGIR